jgi:hypothetical protein
VAVMVGFGDGVGGGGSVTALFVLDETVVVVSSSSLTPFSSCSVCFSIGLLLLIMTDGLLSISLALCKAAAAATSA